MRQPSLTVFYMCEPGRLEWQSICLSASLRALCTDQPALIAYCSAEKFARLRPETVEHHKEYGIPLVQIETRHAFAKPNNHGNKIVACAQKRETEFSVFLDTDTVLIDNLAFEQYLSADHVLAYPNPSHAKPISENEWRYLYSKFGLHLPTGRVKVKLSGEWYLQFPYFNGGVILFPQKTARDPDNPFGTAWLDVASRIDHDLSFPKQKHFLDQTSLPIAIAKAGLRYRVLDRVLNCWVGAKGKFPDPAAKLLHYHYGAHLLNCNQIGIIDEMIREYSAYPSLGELIAAYGTIGLTDKARPDSGGERLGNG